MEKFLEEYLKIMSESEVSLNEKRNEWESVFSTYAKEILGNLPLIQENRKNFHEKFSLRVYLNIFNAREATKKVTFSLRYLGQTIAELTCYDNTLKLSNKDDIKNNIRDFGCDIELKDNDWESPEAQKFRSYFKNHEGKRSPTSKNNYDEARLEDLLLKEFAKDSKKILSNIQPVTLSDLPFKMPTAIGGSDYEVNYKIGKRAAIDILARFNRGGTTGLYIMELKKDNKGRMSKEVMKQALIYTVFIRELLRSNAGSNWWKLFKDDENAPAIPENLTLYSVCVMPLPTNSDPDTSFKDIKFVFNNQNKKWEIKDEKSSIKGDEIHLHYIYFKDNDGKIEIADTSLKE